MAALSRSARIAALSLALAAGVAVATAPDALAQGRLANEQNTIDVVHKYGGSIVAINVTVQGARVNPLQNIPQELRPFFKQFLPQQEQQQMTERAAGSGFVVDDQMHIVTNYHVVEEALADETATIADNADITVRFPGSNEDLPVAVIGVDPTFDLALLKVKDGHGIPDGVKPIPLADSDKVEVGEKAIAVGNPFGLESTVTEGIVSAINRRQEALVSGMPLSYIQTDAAINPGNSGGPLLDSGGRVIGINDQILAPNGTFIGVGFAIPSNVLRTHLDELKKGGFIKKAQIGVSIISLSDYPEAVRHTLNLPDNGAMIVQVVNGGPADRAGLQGGQFTVNAGGQDWPAGGDIITHVNGKPVKNAADLQSAILKKHAGDTVKLTVLHDGKTETKTVQLAVLSKSEKESLSKSMGQSPHDPHGMPPGQGFPPDQGLPPGHGLPPGAMPPGQGMPEQGLPPGHP